MAGVLEVVAHPSGPWLVKAGKFLTPCRRVWDGPCALGRAAPGRPGAPGLFDRRPCGAGREDLLAPEIETWVRELSRALELPSVAKIKGRQAGRPIRFRMPLIPARWVRLLAGRLQFLTGNRSLVAMTLLGVGRLSGGRVRAGRVLLGPRNLGRRTRPVPDVGGLA